jgi:hypothetical protein
MAAPKNPYLKRANEQHEYTTDQILELQRCAADAEYFIDTYCQIQHAVEGSIRFALRPYQRRIISTFANNRLSIALAPRQIGKSWIAGAFLLWFAMFHFEKTVVIASNKNDNAMEMIHRVRFIYERVPHWLKPGLSADGWNKHSCGFDNGSRIISQATSENTGRGLSISLLFLDEFAFVRDSIAEEFWTSVSPTLATGGSCIICSTPNGDINRFAQLWRGANIPSPDDKTVGINGFAPIEVKWDEPPGRDKKFKDEETAKIGETRWKQEYECEFISSDPLLIDSVTLKNLAAVTEKIKPIGIAGEIVFYKEPMQHNTYLIGMDAATGSGEDYTAIVAYEFPSMDQVAEFRTNTMSSVAGYHMLKKMLRIFERAGSTVYFSVENNGVGEAIIALYEADEDPPITAEFVSETGQKRRGMTTSGKTKIQGCLALKEMIERNSMHVKSLVTVRELQNFIRARGSYAAKIGATDDLVMATVLVVRLLSEISTFDQDAYDKLYSHAYLSDSGSSSNWLTSDRRSDDDDDGMADMVLG